MTTKADRAKNLRYKRPALASLGLDIITTELAEISEACSEIQWFIDGDDETLLNALDDDEEDEYEFRMAFSDLSSKAEELNNTLSDYELQDYFDDCTVGLIGNRYTTLGFDELEEDYFSLTGYEQDLAYTESWKRFMRRTKPEMLSIIGQCLGIVITFLDLRQSYNYLKATFDILRDENTSILKVVKEIEAIYEGALEDGFRQQSDKTRHFDMLVANLPEKFWVE